MTYLWQLGRKSLVGFDENGIIQRKSDALDWQFFIEMDFRCAESRIFVLLSFLMCGRDVGVMLHGLADAGKRDLFPAADGIQGGEM